MKAARIQFVAPRAWKLVWLATAATLLAMAGLTGGRLWQQHLVRRDLRMQLEHMQAELAAATAPRPDGADPRETSEQAAQRLLQRDWNLFFDALEVPALAQVRLLQASFDAETGEARLAYELDSFVHEALVTATLGSGPGGPAWQLERLESSGANGAPPGQNAAARVRGTWRARLD